MQANWSLILNVLLLIGVIVAIGRLMKARRQSLTQDQYQPSLGQEQKTAYKGPAYGDDIIAVRRVDRDTLGQNEVEAEPPVVKKPLSKPVYTAPPRITARDDSKYERAAEPKIEARVEPRVEAQADSNTVASTSIMMFLLAKEGRQFAGYELLQTVLASGLRFGEGHLFHRHQFANGQGPVLCSLAAATASGVFDLQNIGAFTVRGLCLFMQTSQNATIDAERFNIMLETAKQLSEGLDAHLLDDQRKPLSEERLARYYRMLHIEQDELEMA